MTLVLSQNKNLFESGIWSDIDTNSFLSGHIKNIPNSDVHLISTNGLLQGVLRFGDINFGPLFIDPASRYSTSYGKSSVVYTFNDLEDSFVQKSGRKHAHIWKREQARETISINQLLNIVLGTIKEDLKGLTAASPPAVLQPAQAKPIVNPAPLTPAVAPPTAAPAKGCRMAIIADQSFARNHANEQGGVKNFLAGLMANIAPTYKRQLGVDLIVGQIHVDSDGSALGQLPTNPNSIVSTVNDRAQSSQSPVNPQDFCAVIVMTSANLDGNAVGVGFIGSVCDAGTNAAVVTDNGKTIPTAQLLSIMVHELGHVFGSQHDGSGNTCGSEREKFVMFPSVQPRSSNMLTFSQCSLDAITAVIGDKDKGCVFGGATNPSQGLVLAQDTLGQIQDISVVGRGSIVIDF